MSSSAKKPVRLTTKAERKRLEMEKVKAKKPHRWSKRTSAQRAIMKIQRQSANIHIVKGQPFNRLLQDTLSEWKCDARTTKELKTGIREVNEDMVLEPIAFGRRLCEKEGRQVLMPRDLQAGGMTFSLYVPIITLYKSHDLSFVHVCIHSLCRLGLESGNRGTLF